MHWECTVARDGRSDTTVHGPDWSLRPGARAPPALSTENPASCTDQPIVLMKARGRDSLKRYPLVPLPGLPSLGHPPVSILKIIHPSSSI